MRASDLPLLTSLGPPSLAPDASRVVVALSHPHLDADADVGQLWEYPLRGTPRRLTRGFSDSAPRFSPDGRLLAFLRAGPGSAPQLQVVDARGGEPIGLTDRTLGVGEFRWTPDSRSIVYLAREPEEGRYGSVDGLDAAAERARRITTLKYRADGVGYTIDRRSQVFLVDVPGLDSEPVYEPAPRPGEHEPVRRVPESRRLTVQDDVEHASPSFSADGSRVVFVAARHASRDRDLRTDVWETPLAGGDAEPVRRTGDEPLSVVQARVGPDGRIWFLAQDLGPRGTDFVGRSTALYLIDGGTIRRLTDPAEHDLGEAGSTITVESPSSVLVADRVRGRSPLLRVHDDGAVETVLGGDLLVTGHDAAAGTIVGVVQTPREFGELAVIDDGTVRTLSDAGAALRATGIATPIELEIAGRDGYPVHGWVAIPPGEGPHPVLLNIHGGPFAQYSVGLFDETQVYVDAGYAVAYCNPRGSAGYGEAHGRAVKEAMGTVDLTDVLDFVDAAIGDHPALDGERVGIIGGSYGGYLTAWTIAHEHRFAAAVVERGFLDPELFEGTSDIGSFFGREYVGSDPARRAAQSPQAVVERVRTPTLVLHSELDLRCPVSQAERYYAALKENGVATELVLFPGENHELSRSGRPRHRLERFEIILDWFARHLPVTGT